jgi:hypothetical protein
LGEPTYAALLEMMLLHDGCLSQWQQHSSNSSSSGTESVAALLAQLLQHSAVPPSGTTDAAAVSTAVATVDQHCDTGAPLALLLRLLPELPLAVQYSATCDLPVLLRLPRMSSAVYSVLSQSCGSEPAGSWQQSMLQLLHSCSSGDTDSVQSVQSHTDGNNGSSSNSDSSSTAVVTATTAAAKSSAITECSSEAQCDKFKTLLKLYAELLARSACSSDAGCAELVLAVALQCIQPQQSVHSFVQQQLAEVAVKVRSLHEVSLQPY